MKTKASRTLFKVLKEVVLWIDIKGKGKNIGIG